MNRIYKVIYSKARQCYIVVSELAKSNHKSSQQGADHTNTPALARIIAVALAAGALTWGSVPEVSWAADTGQADTGQNAAIIQGGIHYFSVNPEGGNRNKNYENDGAVGVDSLAVGAGAHADGRLGATALGNDAVANGERAMARRLRDRIPSPSELAPREKLTVSMPSPLVIRAMPRGRIRRL